MVTQKPFITFVLFTVVVSILMTTACSVELTNPPPDLKSVTLEGTWTAHYSQEETDTIIINSDETFNQIFEDTQEEYIFDSGWNRWALEKLPNGIIRLHLYGGRYYSEGIPLAETNGRKRPNQPCLETDCTWGLEPRSFYDPFADELVQMVDELILVVQLDSRGNLILHHIWSSSDRGFLLINGDREIFYRETE